MKLLLRTPGVQRVAGRKTALLTFTGRTSGRTYTTPVTCIREGDRAIVTCHRTRTWWPNLVEQPNVGVRLAGKEYAGRAVILSEADAIGPYCRYLEASPAIAKASGASLVDGVADRLEVREMLEHTVVIEIDLTRIWSPGRSVGR